MKNTKKLLGAAISIMYGVCFIFPTSVIAAELEDFDLVRTYDPCDVNHDGDVDIMDYIRITKYLDGSQGVVHIEYLDANCNFIVDLADAKRIWAEIFGHNYSSSFIDITSDDFDFSNSDCLVDELQDDLTEITDDTNFENPTREYYRYHSPTNQNNAYLTSYSLTTNYALNSKSLPSDEDFYQTVNGTSLNGIVQLMRSSNPNSYYGTGFIIDDHRIVTSAHCVYTDDNEDDLAQANEFPSDLQIQLCNTDGTVTSTKYNVKEIHIPKRFVTEVSQSSWENFDYALLTVNESLSACTHYKLGTPVNPTSTNFTGIDLFVSGFPIMNHVCTSKGNGQNTSTKFFLSYNNQVGGGMSGSPVYVATNYEIRNANSSLQTPPLESGTIYSAIAIHGYGDGSGPAINEMLMTFFMQDSTNVGY